MQISCRYHYFNKKNDAHMKFIDILVLVKIIIKEVYTDITDILHRCHIYSSLYIIAISK